MDFLQHSSRRHMEHIFSTYNQGNCVVSQQKNSSNTSIQVMSPPSHKPFSSLSPSLQHVSDSPTTNSRALPTDYFSPAPASLWAVCRGPHRTSFEITVSFNAIIIIIDPNSFSYQCLQASRGQLSLWCELFSDEGQKPRSGKGGLPNT